MADVPVQPVNTAPASKAPAVTLSPDKRWRVTLAKGVKQSRRYASADVVKLEFERLLKERG